MLYYSKVSSNINPEKDPVGNSHFPAGGQEGSKFEPKLRSVRGNLPTLSIILSLEDKQSLSDRSLHRIKLYNKQT